jgi:DNA-binding HxlR family transcriptional regulator
MLEKIFGSISRSKIVKFFCTHNEERHYMRELARSLDIKINALSRELDNLEEIGFLKADIKNNRKYYSVNNEFPLLQELRSLIVKSIVLVEKAVTKGLLNAKGIHVLILTGVFIDQDTGTDILLVGTTSKAKIQKLINSLSRSFYQDLRFTMLSPAEYKYRLEVTDKFIYKILNFSPIVIVNKYTR